MFLLGVAFLLLTADLLHERVPPFHALVLALLGTAIAEWMKNLILRKASMAEP